MKILHLPTATGGNAYGLSRGERSLGHQSDVLVARDTYLHYPADRILVPHRGRPLNAWRKGLSLIPSLVEFLRVRRRYDIYHFNFGSSLLDLKQVGLPLLDLPFYPKKAGLVFTYNGDDARLSLPTAKANPHYYLADAADGARRDRKTQAALAKMDRHAGAIFALNPDLLRFLPSRARFLPYSLSSFPALERAPHPPGQGRVLTIVHAPSNRQVKGTEAILAVLRDLAEKYPGRLKVELVENLPQPKAVPVSARADLVIDQIRVGWYGGLAVEAMKLGRPVLAYIREDDLGFIPPDMRRDLKEAVINANPDTLAAVLGDLVENPGQLARQAQAGYEYACRWHDPVLAARQTTAVYEDIRPQA